MKKRLITGFCYVVVLIGFFCLKLFVNDSLFDLLILAFAGFGTFEMLRAFGERVTRAQKGVTFAFSMLCLTLFGVLELLCLEYGLFSREIVFSLTAFAFAAGVAAILGLLVFRHEETGLEGTGLSLLAYLFPNLFLLVLMACNHMELYSFAAILIIFFVCPVADSLAFVFGSLLGKKLPAKMSPAVSPNKTVIGGLGGLLGGAIGALAAFFIYYGLCLPYLAGSFEIVAFDWAELAFYLPLGVIAAAFAQFGDLAESAVKRKLGIKDMGRLLPGHGGVMDRIDSTLYATLAVYFVFLLRIITGV